MKGKTAFVGESASTPRPSELRALKKTEMELRTTTRLKDNANRTARLLYKAGRQVGNAAARKRFLVALEKLERERARLLVALGYSKSLLSRIRRDASKP